MTDESKNNYKRRVRAELKLLVFEYLVKHPCVDCGFSNPLALEFDHVKGDKIKGIGHLVNDCVAWEVIEAEINKCEVRCANCHRLKTAVQLGYWKQFDK